MLAVLDVIVWPLPLKSGRLIAAGQTIFVAIKFAAAGFATAIVLVALLLPRCGSVEGDDEPTDAVFVTEVPAGAVTRAMILSVVLEFGAMVPIFQTIVEDV